MNEYRLQSCKKSYTLDQDKTITPSETVRRALEKLGRRFDLSNVGLEAREDAVEGAYSYTSVSDQLRASGKGLTPEQSQASAIMEFAERYSWLHFAYEGYDGYTVAPFSEMKKRPVETVGEEYFFNGFFELRDGAERLAELKELPLKWLSGLTLPDYRPFNYPLNWHNYRYTSNGLATGNAMEEAIVQALCEVIERENVYRFLHEQKEGNDLDPASIKNPLIIKVLRNARRQGIGFELKEISFELKVPTFIVRGTSEADRGQVTYQGCGQGTHPQPEKALIRALAEYFESYSLLKSRTRGLNINWNLVLPRMEKRHYGFLNFYHPEMFTRRKRTVKISDLTDLSRADIKDEIESILRIMAGRGHRAVWLDKSHPELGIPVCRIFVPTFRNLMVSEVRDPTYILGEAAYEGGRREQAADYLKRALRRSLYHLPPEASQAKPDAVFRQDYRATILANEGWKRDSTERLKGLEAALKAVWK